MNGGSVPDGMTCGWVDRLMTDWLMDVDAWRNEHDRDSLPPSPLSDCPGHIRHLAEMCAHSHSCAQSVCATSAVVHAAATKFPTRQQHRQDRQQQQLLLLLLLQRKKNTRSYLKG